MTILRDGSDDLFERNEHLKAEVERLRGLISAIEKAALNAGMGIVYMSGTPMVLVNHIVSRQTRRRCSAGRRRVLFGKGDNAPRI